MSEVEFKPYKLSIGKAVNLYHRCIRLLSNLNYRTDRLTLAMVYNYVSLAMKQLRKQCKDSEIFRELEYGLDVNTKIADTYYHFPTKEKDNVGS